jgi:hypothetical protein
MVPLMIRRPSRLVALAGLALFALAPALAHAQPAPADPAEPADAAPAEPAVAEDVSDVETTETPQDAFPVEPADVPDEAPVADTPVEPDEAPTDFPSEAEPADAPAEPAAPSETAPAAADDAQPPQDTSAAPAPESRTGRGPKKQVYGWIEDVLIDPEHALQLTAKLDTGADTTSLDARNIRRSRRDGEDYVRFVVTEPSTGQSVELEKPFVRAVRIKAHGRDEPPRRVVVRMRICIGDRSRSIEVNLVDRAHYDYPLLLGRNALRDVAIVDPNLRHTREPTCWRTSEPWGVTAQDSSDTLAPPGDDGGSGGPPEAPPDPAAQPGGNGAYEGAAQSAEGLPGHETESDGGASAECENAPMC